MYISVNRSEETDVVWSPAAQVVSRHQTSNEQFLLQVLLTKQQLLPVVVHLLHVNKTSLLWL